MAFWALGLQIAGIRYVYCDILYLTSGACFLFRAQMIFYCYYVDGVLFSSLTALQLLFEQITFWLPAILLYTNCTAVITFYNGLSGCSVAALLSWFCTIYLRNRGESLRTTTCVESVVWVYMGILPV